MKKTNTTYVAIWYGGALLAAIALFTIGKFAKLPLLLLAAPVFFVVALVLLPGILKTKMEKKALALEKYFPETGFSYQHKFTSNSGVFYIDQGGRLGIVWKHNPTELQFADLSKVTKIFTNNGKQINGTSLVCCQFILEGKNHKIYTLRVSNGQLSMKDPRVLEAISKADALCEMLGAARQNAAGTAQV